jgi:hypothetical protein
MNAILHSHSINPEHLRLDDFEGFGEERKSALLALVEHAMGKPVVRTNEPTAEDASEMEDWDESTMQ